MGAPFGVGLGMGRLDFGDVGRDHCRGRHRGRVGVGSRRDLGSGFSFLLLHLSMLGFVLIIPGR